jgi:hypothetical protein
MVEYPLPIPEGRQALLAAVEYLRREAREAGLAEVATLLGLAAAAVREALEQPIH